MTVDLVSPGRHREPSQAGCAAEAGLRVRHPHWDVQHVVLPWADGLARWQSRVAAQMLRRAEAGDHPWWESHALALLHPVFVSTYARRLAQRRPRLVVSLAPLFNAAIAEAMARACADATLVTVIDDPQDHGPHGWIEPGQRQHFVCYTDRAAQQCMDAGHSARYVHRIEGPLVAPVAPPSAPADRANDVALVLAPSRLRACAGIRAVLAGLRVAEAHAGIEGARAIAASRVAVIGPDARLAAACELSGTPGLLVLGSTPAPMESFTASWVADQGWARVVRDPSEVRREVDGLLIGHPPRPAWARPARPTPETLAEVLAEVLQAEGDGAAVGDLAPPPGWGRALPALPG